MHGDEANQAVRAGILMDTGVYHYDPSDNHGPVMYFAAMPFCHATAENFADTTEWNFRLVTVFFSFLTLLLMLGLGRRSSSGGLFSNQYGALFALLFTAISPALTYYSRFFIQESLLVCFLTGMFASGYGYVRARGNSGKFVKPSVMAALFGMFAGLCLATKETTVLSFAAMFFAAIVVFGFRRLKQFWSTRDLLIATASAALVFVAFFSSFFTYPKGVADALFATVKTYFLRATAVPEHQHPWDFYFKIVFWFKYGRGPVWSEAAVLIPAAVTLLVSWITFFKRGRECSAHNLFVRFMVVYTLVLTALYCAIPYKTPWCALSFLHGYIILGGIGVGYAIDFLCDKCAKPLRFIGLSLLLAFTLWFGYCHIKQNLRACGKFAADPRNPYVYAHTGRDAIKLVASIEKAAADAQGFDTFIAIAVPPSDTWPLPWYLRKYKNVGYWTNVDQIPADLNPVIVVAAADQGDIADKRFGKGKHSNFYGIRPGTLLNLFVPKVNE